MRNTQSTFERSATRPPASNLQRHETEHTHVIEVPKVEGLLVTFENVAYSVRTTNKGSLTILKGVTGYLQPGHLTAMMGPSGSGKTTLLDILAGRKTIGSITGQIMMGGDKPTRPFLTRYIGYVEQSDLLLGSLTVYEMLSYTAELKLPEGMAHDEKQKRVHDMIDTLRVNDCRDTKIGGAVARGISGGQVKRVNIGISLVTSPRVLLLDEPTSGLDSFTAEEIVSALRALGFGGQTICATIHAPSRAAFQQFDTLIYLLAGNVVYIGPTGMHMVAYFSNSNLANRNYANGDNEAEWLAGITTSADKDGSRTAAFKEYYDRTAAAQVRAALLEAQAAAAALVASGSRPTGAQLTAEAGSGTAVSTWKALKVFFWYRTLKDLSTVQYLGGRVMDKLMGSIILVLVYAAKGNNTSPKDVQSVVGALFLWVTFGTFSFAYLDTIMSERALFMRERFDGLYTVFSYLAAKLFQELLVLAGGTMICSVLVFYVIDFQGQFIIFWLGGYLTYCVGICTAFFLAALCPTSEVASGVMAGYTGSLLYFSGLVLNLNTIPVYLQWYGRIAYTRYAFNALLANQYSGSDLKVQGDATPRDFYGVQGSPGENLGYLICFAAFFAALAYIAMSLVHHTKR